MLRLFKSLLLLISVFGGAAFAADNVIINPRPDEDTVIKVNDGGVIKEVMRFDASEGGSKVSGGTVIDETITGAKTLLSGETLLMPRMDLTSGGGQTITLNSGSYLYSDSIDGGTIIGDGTITDISTKIPLNDSENKKNQILFKLQNSSYNITTAGVLELKNVPEGYYKVTVGAQHFQGPENLNGIDNANAGIRPQLNGSAIFIPGDSSDVWRVGWTRIQGAPNGGAAQDTAPFGWVSTIFIRFPASVNTFSLTIDCELGMVVNRPFYILERVQDAEFITSEWD
jgi:hypothetical protein